MKKLLSVIAVLFFGLVLCLTSVSAQENDSKTVSVGLVNGKAVKLVLPVYPPAAKAVRAGGTVNVEVTIDEQGDVVSAKSVSGHPLLREAAETAALESKFTPTKLSGRLIKVSGVIVYNFVSDEKRSPNSVESEESSDAGAEKSVGIINGKAKSLPKPDYPPAAKAVRAGGAVSVEVLVDEQGSVTSATAVSGHPLLRQAAEKAALEAKFSPTRVDGPPVKVKGIIVYNFVLPKKAQKK